jgi:hypothetical protein
VDDVDGAVGRLQLVDDAVDLRLGQVRAPAHPHAERPRGKAARQAGERVVAAQDLGRRAGEDGDVEDVPVDRERRDVGLCRAEIGEDRPASVEEQPPAAIRPEEGDVQIGDVEAAGAVRLAVRDAAHAPAQSRPLEALAAPVELLVRPQRSRLEPPDPAVGGGEPPGPEGRPHGGRPARAMERAALERAVGMDPREHAAVLDDDRLAVERGADAARLADPHAQDAVRGARERRRGPRARGELEHDGVALEHSAGHRIERHRRVEQRRPPPQISEVGERHAGAGVPSSAATRRSAAARRSRASEPGE